MVLCGRYAHVVHKHADLWGRQIASKIYYDVSNSGVGWIHEHLERVPQGLQLLKKSCVYIINNHFTA